MRGGSFARREQSLARLGSTRQLYGVIIVHMCARLFTAGNGGRITSCTNVMRFEHMSNRREQP